VRLIQIGTLALAAFGSACILATAQSPLPPDQHYGDIADPSVWPMSAIGRVNVITGTDASAFCTGTLVTPTLVLTAAHCVFQEAGRRSVVHFVAAGVPSEHSIAKRLLISPEYVAEGEFRVENVQNDWAIIVLKDAFLKKPISVRSLTFSELSRAGPFMHVGYGADRPFLPSVVRDCAVAGRDEHSFTYRCLTNFGYSGAPILAQIDGTYSVIGIGSGGNHETRVGFACSATQFAKAIAELSRSE
jgi:V8-like Glu-specific endopeptidase